MEPSTRHCHGSRRCDRGGRALDGCRAGPYGIIDRGRDRPLSGRHRLWTGRHSRSAKPAPASHHRVLRPRLIEEPIAICRHWRARGAVPVTSGRSSSRTFWTPTTWRALRRFRMPISSRAVRPGVRSAHERVRGIHNGIFRNQLIPDDIDLRITPWRTCPCEHRNRVGGGARYLRRWIIPAIALPGPRAGHFGRSGGRATPDADATDAAWCLPALVEAGPRRCRARSCSTIAPPEARRKPTGTFCNTAARVSALP